MSPKEVERLIGPPLFLRDPRWGYRIDGSPDTIWSYSGDHCAVFGDYAWQAFEVVSATAQSSRCRESGVTIELRRGPRGGIGRAGT